MWLFSRPKKLKHGDSSKKPKKESYTQVPSPETAIKKPKCERDYEAACQALQARIASELAEPNGAGLYGWRAKNQLCERTLDANLQRQNRLRELKMQMQMQIQMRHEESDWVLLDKSSAQDREHVESKLDEEIRDLRRRYKIILGRLDQLAFPARFCAFIKVHVLAREHRNRYGRTFVWLHYRGRCADGGGCCGRACNCCERPLRTYLRPTDEEEREVFEFRGHCTSECVCCNRFYDSYTPSPTLPPTAFKDCWR